MKGRFLQTAFLFCLAVVFTVGLTFATVELPYRIDHIIQGRVTTPGFDSHADEASRLQTELFIDHYNLRETGYFFFALMVILLITGFATRRTALAAAGAFTFMLPVFAQFAGVMFFLAGLGILNILWLPLLDISYDLQQLGMVIHAPYDLLMWLLGKAGINGYRYIVNFFIGGGLLLFFLGTWAWLIARGGRKKVADIWIYRFSRHPQYAGWIIWSYGVYLLLLRGLYPKRSWGIGASLPWLLSTIFIIGVAMAEEIRMARLHGSKYEKYRLSAPFLFPLPLCIRRLFSVPLRLIFKKEFPVRRREVAAVLSLYTALLLSISALFYMDGTRTISLLFRPAASRQEELEDITRDIEVEDRRIPRYRLAERLRSYGNPSVEHFVRLLGNEKDPVRLIAIDALGKLGSEKTLPVLVGLLDDHSADIRWHATIASGAIFSRLRDKDVALADVDANTKTEKIPAATREMETIYQLAREALAARLDDTESYIRIEAMKSLAYAGSDTIVERAKRYMGSDEKWFRAGTIDALGLLRSEKAVDIILAGLVDDDAYVRRRSVIALVMSRSRRGCPVLEKAAGDDDREVRLYAAEALKRLCP
ncbi:MAG: HEAT repeat domain-containing protein [Candidatus Krumholzibacteriota bacterium]|nr:HEAT repeat domain-containing protein [Candidatus Krumholzibacteriota bacterium]